jgi:DNA recombination protein RmuC
VTARRFPGIDQTKLDALAAPTIVEKTPRRLTAPELLDGTLDLPEAPSALADAEGAASVDGLLTADLGDVRERISPQPDSDRVTHHPGRS